MRENTGDATKVIAGLAPHRLEITLIAIGAITSKLFAHRLT